MTREEAITELKNIQDNFNYSLCPNEVFEMAIEALKAMPCEDAVSREALLEKLEEWDWQDLYLPVHFKELVDDLPPFTPKQRTGKWILVRNKLGATIDRICSCCNRSHEKTSDFCPNCGAKMEGDR